MSFSTSSLFVVSYPKLDEESFQWIQNIRQNFDGDGYKLIAPHFTLVFPTSKFTDKEFIGAVGEAASSLKSFDFELLSALLLPPINEDPDSYVFLVPDRGFHQILKIHDKLYAGPLHKEHRFDIPFIPHVTIAHGKDLLKCKALAEKINSEGVAIRGQFDTLDIVKKEGATISTLLKIRL